jgi:hypothetical protein
VGNLIRRIIERQAQHDSLNSCQVYWYRLDGLRAIGWVRDCHHKGAGAEIDVHNLIGPEGEEL